jgi:hypothetical protein
MARMFCSPGSPGSTLTVPRRTQAMADLREQLNWYYNGALRCPVRVTEYRVWRLGVEFGAVVGDACRLLLPTRPHPSALC